MRSDMRSGCPFLRCRRSPWASTIVPSAAVMSSAEVASKGMTYWVKMSTASEWTLSPWAALALSRPTAASVPMLPTVTACPTATTSMTPMPMAAMVDATRWERKVSANDSEVSTPTSITTKRNSMRIAPV